MQPAAFERIRDVLISGACYFMIPGQMKKAEREMTYVI